MIMKKKKRPTSLSARPLSIIVIRLQRVIIKSEIGEKFILFENSIFHFKQYLPCSSIVDWISMFREQSRPHHFMRLRVSGVGITWAHIHTVSRIEMYQVASWRMPRDEWWKVKERERELLWTWKFSINSREGAHVKWELNESIKCQFNFNFFFDDSLLFFEASISAVWKWAQLGSD